MMKKFDIFSFPFTFQHQGKSSIQTTSGGFLSILCIISIIASIILFGKNFYNRLNPKVFYKYVNNFNRSSIRFDDVEMTNYTLKLFNPKFNISEYPGLRNFYNNTKENQIFMFKDNSISNNILKTPFLDIKLIYDNKICPITHINCTDHNDLNFYCLTYFVPVVGGGNSLDEGNAIKIYFNRCEGINCLDKDSLDAIFKDIKFINFTLSNTKIQLDNYTYPFEYFDQYFSTPIKDNTIYLHYIVYDKIIIETDDDIIFSNYEAITVFEFDHDYIISGFNEHKTETIVKINLSNTIKYYKRSYEKIQEMFANIGGIIKFLLFLYGNINNLLSWKLYYIEIANNIWVFEEKSKSSDISNKTNRIKINSTTLNNTNKSSELRNNIQYKSCKHKSNIELNLKEILMIIMCYKSMHGTKLKNKYHFLSKCKNKIDECLDGVSAIKRIIQMDILKWLLFDSIQLQCINYLFKKRSRIESNINIDDNIENKVNFNKFNLRNSNGLNLKINKLLQEDILN